jgi:hypothetical protein
MLRWKDWLTRPWLVAFVLGTAMCCYAIPLRMLNPMDIGWMNRLDTIGHWAGWEHFRNGPLLQLPIGANPYFGLEHGSTLVFSDSIALVALLLRPIQALLPVPFQYLGLWTLACFILQAYFAYRLMARVFSRPATVVVAAAMFLLCPPMLNRIHVHTSLLSHWIILAALLAYFETEDWCWVRWWRLICLAALVHGYLFGMVGAVWLAHLIKIAALGRLRGGVSAIARAAAGALGVVSGCGAVMWLVGYFGIQGPSTHLYGSGRYDLAGPVCTFELWSRVFPFVPCGSRRNDWDGQAFFGVDFLAILAIALVVLAVRRSLVARSSTLPRWPLVVVSIFVTAFAATNTVGFASHDILSYPLPARVLAIAETFRGSGRMMWPVYYAALVGVMALFARAVPPRFHLRILLPLLAFQVWDLQLVLRLLNHYASYNPHITELRSPTWRNLAAYDALISVPAVQAQVGWEDLTWQAIQHKAATNIGLFNRSDLAKIARARRREIDELLSGRLDPRVVYLVPNHELWLIARDRKSPGDAAVTADGHRLIFPHGAALGLVDEPAASVPQPLGVWRSAADHGDGERYLSSGWSWPEQWGRWADGPLASVALLQTADQVGVERDVVLDVIAPGFRDHRGQRYRIDVAGERLTEGVIRSSGFVHVTVPARLNQRRGLVLVIELPDATGADDGRVLALGVRRLWISDQPGTTAPLLTPAQQQLVDAPPDDARLPLDEWREVGSNKPGERYLLGGWSWPEWWGRWNEQATVSLALPQAGELGQPVTVKLGVIAHTTRKSPAQRYAISVAGRKLAEGSLAGEQDLAVVVPAELTRRRTIVVALDIPGGDPVRDGRVIAIGIKRVALSRAPAP